MCQATGWQNPDYFFNVITVVGNLNNLKQPQINILEKVMLTLPCICQFIPLEFLSFWKLILLKINIFDLLLVFYEATLCCCSLKQTIS